MPPWLSKPQGKRQTRTDICFDYKTLIPGRMVCILSAVSGATHLSPNMPLSPTMSFLRCFSYTAFYENFFWKRWLPKRWASIHPGKLIIDGYTSKIYTLCLGSVEIFGFMVHYFYRSRDAPFEKIAVRDVYTEWRNGNNYVRILFTFMAFIIYDLISLSPQ